MSIRLTQSPTLKETSRLVLSAVVFMSVGLSLVYLATKSTCSVGKKMCSLLPPPVMGPLYIKVLKEEIFFRWLRKAYCW